MATSLQQTSEPFLDEFKIASQMLLEYRKHTIKNIKLKLHSTKFIQDCSSLSYKNNIFSWLNNGITTPPYFKCGFSQWCCEVVSVHFDGVSCDYDADEDVNNENWNIDDMKDRVFYIRILHFVTDKEKFTERGVR